MASSVSNGDCSKSEESYLGLSSKERTSGSDLHYSHIFPKKTTTPFKGYVSRRETTTFYKGCIVGCSGHNLPSVDVTDTRRVKECAEKKDQNQDNADQAQNPSVDLVKQV